MIISNKKINLGKMCMSHQFIKLLRTLAAIRRSEDSKVDDKQAVEYAKNLIDSENLSLINESEHIRYSFIFNYIKNIYKKKKR